jgi:hypothetical protein
MTLDDQSHAVLGIGDELPLIGRRHVVTVARALEDRRRYSRLRTVAPPICSDVRRVVPDGDPLMGAAARP